MALGVKGLGVEVFKPFPLSRAVGSGGRAAAGRAMPSSSSSKRVLRRSWHQP